MGLRLGVACAIVDDEDRLLLSQRANLKVWNLPGGRLDAAETLADAAAREVHEETGVIAQIERPLNLYYWAGFQRLNVLFSAWPLGGELLPRTSESRSNQYFARDSLPKLLDTQQIKAIFTDERSLPETIALTESELWRVQRRPHLRWVQNLLRGSPEPSYPRFDVRAVGLVWDRRFQRLLTLEGKRGRALPRLRCSGLVAPWDELQARVKQHCGIVASFQWVGVWQNVERGIIELVFAAAAPEKTPIRPAEWSIVINTPFSDRDMHYIEQVKPSFAADPVWTLVDSDTMYDEDMIILNQMRV